MCWVDSKYDASIAVAVVVPEPCTVSQGRAVGWLELCSAPSLLSLGSAMASKG